MARRDPSGRECAEQLGGGGAWQEVRRLGSEVGAKQPERCQMIGEAPSHRRTPASRRALCNITSGDMK